VLPFAVTLAFAAVLRAREQDPPTTVVPSTHESVSPITGYDLETRYSEVLPSIEHTTPGGGGMVGSMLVSAVVHSSSQSDAVATWGATA